MLIDHMVEYCNKVYTSHISENPCNECNHPISCRGTCANCLDQVHFPHLRCGGRSDYNCEHLPYYYTCRYSHKYCSEIIYALNEIKLNDYPFYNILSMGCGSAPDLMAFDCLKTWRGSKKDIRYRGYDRNPLWEPIHNEIITYASNNNMDVKFQHKDVFNIFTDDYSNYNVLIIQYLLSHLYNTNQISEINNLYDMIIEKVIANKCDRSPFLIIINDVDSSNRGRNYFWPFHTKIETAGYETNAIARCFNSDLYLENSRQHPYCDNQFDINETIKEKYMCAISCTSAQLIIEVR